jgi:F0F1-type ATP synthase assembly protein I
MAKDFNIQESFIVKLKQILDEENEKLSPKDKKFFNLDIIMDLGRFSQKNSYDCDECKTNKDILLDMSKNLSKKINTLEGRREITKKLDQISTHLRKKHKLYIRRYISSLYTSLMMIGGLAIGAIVGLFIGTYKYPILIGGAIGIFIGTVWGSIKENILKKKGQIYGKF